MRRALALLLATLAALPVAASTGLIQLTSFPSAAVADGHSRINIDAEVRDTNGRSVPDGTKVLFTTDLGTFEQPVISTINGRAHAQLIAAAMPGVAKITATALTYDATAFLKYEFAADRASLSNARRYIEVTADKSLSYSYDQKTITAIAGKNKAVLIYRDVRIEAESLQVMIDSGQVKAHKAVLKLGKNSHEFGDLYYALFDRSGFGTTVFTHPVAGIQPVDDFIKIAPSDKTETSYGVAEITGIALKTPDQPSDPGLFRFDDLSSTTTEIHAKKITAFPQRRVQFQAASVYVGGARIITQQYYQVDLTSSSPVFSDQILNVNNSQLAVNYPYYLSLKPGVTSLLRLRTGETESTGLSASHGIFLDYEYNWDHGDDMQGGVAWQGIGRSDWGIVANQSFHAPNGGGLSALLELPEHRSIYGSVTASEPFKGYEFSASANGNHTFTGTPFNTQDFNLSLDKDPFKIGNLPAQFFVGVEAYSTTTQTVGFIDALNDQLNPVLQQQTLTDSQSAYGVRFRGQSQTLSFGRHTNFTASFSLAKLMGHNALNGLTYLASGTLNHNFGKGLSTSLTYDYTEDGFNSDFLGRQQLTLNAGYSRGKALINFFAIRGIDMDRHAYQLDTSYQLNRTWRVGLSLTDQRYLGQNYTDYSVVLGYRIGYKEFGLVWSQKTHRIGFQLLGTSFN